MFDKRLIASSVMVAVVMLLLGGLATAFQGHASETDVQAVRAEVLRVQRISAPRAKVDDHIVKFDQLVELLREQRTTDDEWRGYVRGTLEAIKKK